MARVKRVLGVMVALAVTLASSATAAHAQATWTIVASPSPSTQDNQLLAVASVAAADVWAVGRADNSSTPSQYEPLIEHWDGTAWRVVPSPTTGIGELWGSPRPPAPMCGPSAMSCRPQDPRGAARRR